ncbi:unnamed protein product [Caenorhabditis sp. 36 PRJEB53466]|nr:unnamed protein product [Caenorhabditis sp. 36 PRJEB53466]
MSHGSLVDPSFELIDPCPDIHALFVQFDDRFFGGALSCCEVKWSPRMYSCAGICSYEVRGGRGGLCSIRLSKPLLTLRPRKDLVETLLHEMIHAFLFVKERNRDRDGHGPQFQAHMHRINQSSGTNITIYHSFHDEVRLYKQHWWRCAGPCRDRRPFFGYVKRSCNRAPGPNDRWWKQHQETCGGRFEKVKEPEGYGQKKSKKKREETGKNAPAAKKANTSPPKDNKTLDDYFKKPSKKGASPVKPSTSSPIKVFGGTGQKLGGSSATSTLLNSFPGSSRPALPKVEVEVICLSDSDGDDEDILEISFVASPTTVICPSCNEELLEAFIHSHLDECLA